MSDRRYALLKHQHDNVEIIAPTLLNSWANYGVGWTTAGYWKDSNGMVHLRGLVVGGSDSTTIFNLPEEYRPAAPEIFICLSHDGTVFAASRVDVQEDGDVFCVSPAPTASFAYLSLAGISFLAGI